MYSLDYLNRGAGLRVSHFCPYPPSCSAVSPTAMAAGKGNDAAPSPIGNSQFPIGKARSRIGKQQLPVITTHDKFKRHVTFAANNMQDASSDQENMPVS